MAHVRLTMDERYRPRVEVDGRELGDVPTAVTISVDAYEGPSVWIQLVPDALDVDLPEVVLEAIVADD
jgi:hypothetical protein